MANGELWVIDTQGIIEIRRELNLERRDQEKVFDELTKMVENGDLVFPKMVHSELKRNVDLNVSEEDLGLAWAKKNLEKASKESPSYGEIQAVLHSHSQLPRLIDHNRPYGSDGVEDADPHVLTMAVRLRDSTGRDVKILTRDKTNRAGMISLTTAAACKGIVCLPADVFLRDKGIIK